MEVNQILMMPVSFGGWQSHDDLKKNNLICYYTFDNYAYFSGNAPMTSDAQKFHDVNDNRLVVKLPLCRPLIAL